MEDDTPIYTSCLIDSAYSWGSPLTGWPDPERGAPDDHDEEDGE